MFVSERRDRAHSALSFECFLLVSLPRWLCLLSSVFECLCVLLKGHLTHDEVNVVALLHVLVSSAKVLLAVHQSCVQEFAQLLAVLEFFDEVVGSEPREHFSKKFLSQWCILLAGVKLLDQFE